jgi:hypothetical protein
MIGLPLAVWVIGALLAVAAAGVGAYVYYDQRDPEETPDLNGARETGADAARDGLAAAREAAAWLATATYGTERKRTAWRVVGVLAGVLAGVGLFAAVAYVGWGLLAAGLFVIGLVAGALAIPGAILLFRDGVPSLLGTGLAIAAQIAFGKAGLVRREDGQYEWGALREDGDGRYVALADGGRIDVDATDGDLFSFGFGQLAVSEAHGSNLDRFRARQEDGDRTRAGFDVATPDTDADGIVVTLARIQRVIRGAASSELVRRGRDKALDDAGGTGQLSQLWTMAFAAVLLVVGFAMAAGVLML